MHPSTVKFFIDFGLDTPQASIPFLIGKPIKTTGAALYHKLFHGATA